MRVRRTFFNRCKFLVGNGRSTRFWEDTWLGDTPLAMQYPSLYNIVQRKESSVHTVLSTVPLNVEFRRALVGQRWESWLNLVRRLMQVNLTTETDSIRWRLSVSGVFSVKSM